MSVVRRAKPPKVCPVLNVKCGQAPAGYIFCEVKAVGFKEPIAAMELTSRSGFLGVDFIEVYEQKLARCGVGTKLYEAALRQACERGLVLASDTSRTNASEGFWKKQARKGRADCVRKDFGGHRLDESFSPTGEKWPCGRWAMKEACPTAFDLSGVRRRRKRR
jgi:hypothetical protein